MRYPASAWMWVVIAYILAVLIALKAGSRIDSGVDNAIQPEEVA